MHDEPPAIDGGLAFGERDLFSAEGEFGGEKVVVGDDEKAVGSEEGEAFPLLGHLVPRKALGGEVEVFEIEEEGFLHVLDRLFGGEGLEVGVALS